jgi:uncharacterized protein YciI
VSPAHKDRAGPYPLARAADVVVKTIGMEFFCYHRDRPGSVTLREELLEQHWSYMDRYQAQMIARGPTLAGDTPTGSVHIVGLPDPAAAVSVMVVLVSLISFEVNRRAANAAERHGRMPVLPRRLRRMLSSSGTSATGPR